MKVGQDTFNHLEKKIESILFKATTKYKLKSTRPLSKLAFSYTQGIEGRRRPAEHHGFLTQKDFHNWVSSLVVELVRKS